MWKTVFTLEKIRCLLSALQNMLDLLSELIRYQLIRINEQNSFASALLDPEPTLSRKVAVHGMFNHLRTTASGYFSCFIRAEVVNDDQLVGELQRLEASLQQS